MTSLPPRPPAADAREAAFVRDLRANLESRARDFETKASDAAAAMQRRLATASIPGFSDSEKNANANANASKMPSATHLVELARKPARRMAEMADTVARLAPDDNALIRGMKTHVRSAATGMRRVRTADEPLARRSSGSDDKIDVEVEAEAPSSNGDGTNATFAPTAPFALPSFPALSPPPLPGALRERVEKVALPEWDVFKSLKTDRASGDPNGASKRRWTPPRPPLPLPPSGASLDDLLRVIESKIEEKIGATPFSSAKSGGGKSRALAPSEFLSKVHDAGNAAVREWMAAAREKAETAALEKKSRGKKTGAPAERAASMTEAEFAEAEAAAAAMELRIKKMSSMSSMSSDASGDVGDAPPAGKTANTNEIEIAPLASESADSAASTIATMDERRRSADFAASSSRPTATGESDASFERTTRRSTDGVGSRKSLREPGRSVAIVTTASLPWMTGTAVNPLLRAAYLSKRGAHDVTLVVPWLPPAEQALIHPSMIFQTPEAQAAYVRQWVKERCGFEPTNMKLDFYPGRYATDKYSIIPVGDVSSYITSKKRDVAILEEPEHLNWYHSGSRWSDTFEHVVGVVHTNYLEYARLEQHGEVKEAAMRFVNSWVSRMHCHKIIKLSDAVQDFPRSETMNVHGVSPVFLEVGRRKATAAAQASAAENDPDAAAAQAVGRTVGRALASLGARAERREERRRKKKSETKAGKEGRLDEKNARDWDSVDDAPTPEAIHPSREVFNKGCYFLGKVVWGKGFHELLQRVEEHNKSEDGASFPLELDVYGSGEDFSDVSRTSAAKNLPLTFKGRADHASDQMHDYKVFVNPSLSDVVATTTAEALAMGKYVIVAEHPSNAFFATFPNCLVYRDPAEFSACVKKALSSDPAPLSTRDRYRLSWEAATDRFLDAAELGLEQSQGPGSTSADKMAEKMAHFVHSAAARVEPLRRAAGAGAATRVGPETVDGKWTPPWVKTG